MDHSNREKAGDLPHHQGLYDPQYEHDACGIGFVVDIKGRKSPGIVGQALAVLRNLSHRGACGCEPNTGDGAGILLQVPHRFLKRVGAEEGFDLPEPGRYGVGMVYLPHDEEARRACESRVAEIVAAEGQTLLGWRTVPTDGSSLGKTARAGEPLVRQLFVGRGPELQDGMAFERKLYVIRRLAEKALRYSEGAAETGTAPFYISSLSRKTIIYKGMLMSEQLGEFYPDLLDPDMESALALVHSRFSTNTFPTWERAHPYRYMIHNGEINTLRGNVNWMRAREAMFESHLFGDDLQKVLPIINPDGSDTAMFDNCLEFLVLAGRSLPHAVMMMIPEPWENHESMDDEKRAFYQYHSALMEPWDGPASIGFTDGVRIGAVLDRNGLRPSRYYVTKDGLVVLASEVGVLDIPAERVLYKGRLEPGRMFLVDTEAGRIVNDAELKRRMATAKPYGQWVGEHMISLGDLPGARVDGYRSVSFNQLLSAKEYTPGAFDHAAEHGRGGNFDILSLDGSGTGREALVQLQQAFGYSYEDLTTILGPMAQNAIEPVGSMGHDAPLAVLSERPQLLYDYFKQLFAQVTNPPIDAIREEMITSSEVLLGSEGNLLDPRPESCQRIKLKGPILTNGELARLRLIDRPGFKTVSLPILYKAAEGGAGLQRAMDELFAAASEAIAGGANIVILSDRGVDRQNAPIPSLLAVAGLHHHLIREGTRTRVSLVMESGEAREVHHFATLVGYGASAINPYMAYRSLDDMIAEKLLTDVDYAQAEYRYTKAATKGVVKVLSKMGISTIQSYCGAQIFEAIGLSQELVDRCFTGTPTRIEGIGLDVIARESAMRHARAFPSRVPIDRTLESGGVFQWRHDGEQHRFNPETIALLQKACRTGSYDVYQEYAQVMNDESRLLVTLRALLDLELAPEPISLEEVESVESICTRFKSGAMSFGSISKEAHETLAIAMNRMGGKSNSGEGGEDPIRYIPDPSGDSRSSAIKQVASGRFGVDSSYLVSAKELQIKMAQGAKPGEGGQLPGRKVYPWVAKVRNSTPGVGLISPPPHHDIYSIEDLAELIHDLKNANHHARINVKLVSEVGVGTIAAGVAKGHADVILISGYDGGTGASPKSSIKHAGLPWELGLAETHQTLVLNNLRSRVRLETDGQLNTGRDVVIAALLGAEEYGFATGPLVAIGCTKMRVCQADTCPVGIATQNPELRKKFAGDPEHVLNYMRFIAQDMREWMAKLGFRTVDEMIGRTDRLKVRETGHYKAKHLDFSRILYQPDAPAEVGRYRQIPQDHGLDRALDNQLLLELCEPALERGLPVRATLPISNTNRVVGTILGSEVTRRHSSQGLLEDTIGLHFQGSAGQSFGAFIPPGITLILEGDTNDYLGKGLSGGKVVLYPPKDATFVAEENVITGNVALYGATGGEAYVRGRAGERFCVRNSGATAVVEGIGDHGCEYMTGGRVVVLGPTGRNFAAGMSGGIAYVLDEAGDFHGRCNQEMVYLERLDDPEEMEEVREMIRRHADCTGSEPARRVLDSWKTAAGSLVKVMPKDYKRMLEAFKMVEAAGLSGEEAVMAAFEQNARDLARVSGN
jgi:glutamate synthase domain-containing protein 2/glutamate synthase domain-containing protein 1/glutamate synthase domain-containing protein 3